MKNLKFLIFGMILTSIAFQWNAQARVGGGRSFGYRGSRGFVAPRNSFSNPNYRSTNPSGYQNPYSQPYSPPQNSMPRPGSTFLKSLGAGIAGGMIGGMLSRAIGGGGYGYAGGSGGTGGIGILEIVLIGGLLYFLFRLFFQRSEATSTASTDGAAALMRKARSGNWEDRPASAFPMNPSQADQNVLDSTPINTDLAMDLFFKIQGAWANRDLSSVVSLLDKDAKEYLEQELTRLKAAHQINRLENIAVRNTEVIETWRESYQEFSTVRILANLLDYTVDENNQQVLSGSKTDPVKFEEYWTFSRDMGSSNWKLSAIQQS